MKNLDYGVIGNCRSAALIDPAGSIDWCCMPYFDSSSIFAALLDKKVGGRFAVKPVGDYKITQEYLPKTNVLLTRFKAGRNEFELIDFMPRYKTESGSYYTPPDIIRLLRRVKGKPKLRIHYDPRPGYAQGPVKMELTNDFLKHHTNNGRYESVYLYSDFPLVSIAENKPVELDRDHYMLLSYNQKLAPLDIDAIRLEYERTKVYWMGWVAKTTKLPEYNDEIERSALVLKLLSYQKTGAILAAVTTSLPETIGEVRNWDYRYCWLRDASMVISTMTRLGHFNTVKRFLQFILDIVPYKDEKIQIMYGIHNNKKLTERELPWLSGYENSKPVRVGNAAYSQKQNDIYGVMMDVIYQSLCLFHNTLDNREDLWTVVRTLVRHVRNNWQKTDRSIWEFRSEKKHFTFSKILCWVAMDRAVKIANIFGKQNEALDWGMLRDRIKMDILEKGINKYRALTQSYCSNSFDAANLMADSYGFIDPHDPIFQHTVLQTYEKLCVDGLMYRYRTADDFGVPKSSFTVCTFWMIKSLYNIGKTRLARELFEQILSYRNPLGLYSEDIEFNTKRLVGNFPQGYSHLALIDTAWTLSGANDTAEQHEHFAT